MEPPVIQSVNANAIESERQVVIQSQAHRSTKKKAHKKDISWEDADFDDTFDSVSSAGTTKMQGLTKTFICISSSR
jgi:hypothetical protein